jgi:3-hydroxybutyryl-CoA dehydrogenase
MRVIVVATGEQQKEIKIKNTSGEVDLYFENELPLPKELKTFDAFFILNLNIATLNFAHFETKPVFINAVIDTLTELKLPNNVSRINAWPGFLQNEIWEIVSKNKNEVEDVFKNLGWKIIFVKDEPGLVAARVISMIINEAFLAFNENVSTIEEIDLAMKLGTNYPYGPFEWAEKIGLKNIFDLLRKLNEKDARYLPSSALENCIIKSGK